MPEILSFFISFAVIGFYWAAHRQFFRLLRAAPRGVVVLNLVYLAIVAFLPFPTALIGEYANVPQAVAIYAVCVASVSGLEAAMFARARRDGALTREIPGDVYRWALAGSLAPVASFLASIPVAFVNTVAAMLMWALPLPLGVLLNRWKPAGADEYRP